MSKVEKEYFKAEKNIQKIDGKLIDNGIKFIGEKGDVIYFAGGNEYKAKFLLQVLVQRLGAEEAQYVYGELEKALLDITNIKIPNIKGTGSLVMYKYSLDNKKDLND